jgi:hypothetical protein
MKTATNRARPGTEIFTMAITEAQPKSGASLDSKCKMPAITPLQITTQPTFPHSLQDFCIAHKYPFARVRGAVTL